MQKLPNDNLVASAADIMPEDTDTDNVTSLPNEQRLAEIRGAAELYLQRADLPICVENKPYVRELAALLGSPEGWAAFASAARIAHTSLNMQTPQLLAARRENDEQLQRLHDTAEGIGRLDLATLIAAYLRA